MDIKKGDYVTRNSYNNDTVFKVINVKDNMVYLKGVEVRLVADALVTDLRKEENVSQDNLIDEIKVQEDLLVRGEYFYLPAKVLHIDADEEYLRRCLKFYKKKGNINDLKNYKNSAYFVKAVKVARNYEKSHEKLVIIAGACQSDYEELIKAGANFASSPKRINIHALDPAIIASTISLTERSREIDLKKLLDKTKYKEEGMGGIICNGLMYVGYPR